MILRTIILALQSMVGISVPPTISVVQPVIRTINIAKIQTKTFTKAVAPQIVHLHTYSTFGAIPPLIKRVPRILVALPTTTTSVPITLPITQTFTSADLPQPWLCIGYTESRWTPTENSGNGYYGEFQYSPSTWNYAASNSGLGIPNGRPDLQPLYVQYIVSVWLSHTSYGYSPWYPDCGI